MRYYSGFLFNFDFENVILVFMLIFEGLITKCLFRSLCNNFVKYVDSYDYSYFVNRAGSSRLEETTRIPEWLCVVGPFDRRFLSTDFIDGPIDWVTCFPFIHFIVNFPLLCLYLPCLVNLKPDRTWPVEGNQKF